MWSSLSSDAGRATLALGLVAGLIAYPPLLSWLAAVFALAYAAHHYHQAFWPGVAEADEAA